MGGDAVSQLTLPLAVHRAVTHCDRVLAVLREAGAAGATPWDLANGSGTHNADRRRRDLCARGYVITKIPSGRTTSGARLFRYRLDYEPTKEA